MAEIRNKAMYVSEKIELTREFKNTLWHMEERHDSLFITGDAGTGKSTLLKHFIEHTQKQIVVLAPTGAAAVNVGGVTLHSYFRMGHKTSDEVTYISKRDIDLYACVDAIVIDEISMVRVDVMERVDRFLRENLEDERPFAGKQLIMIGDLFQLSPVVVPGDEKAYIQDRFASEFFFSAGVWRKLGYRKLKLTRIFRQKEQEFVSYLNKVKYGRMNAQELSAFNKRCFHGGFSNEAVTLCTRNKDAEAVNMNHLNEIDGGMHWLEGKIVGTFNQNSCPVDQNIPIKEGARIMMCSNHPKRLWMNGTMGDVLEIKDEYLHIKLEGEKGKEVKVQKEEWESLAYNFDRRGGKITHTVVGTFVQFPVRLAWAISIHKSQGKTFSAANVDFGRGTFGHGMAYVALSRCRSIEKLNLVRPVRLDDIKLNSVVRTFDEYCKWEQI